MEPFIGQIQAFGFNFAPRGWAFCDGQLLPISANSALFSLLGTIYGGDGETTLALPDLRSRSIVHHGNGPGLSTIQIGQRGGIETRTLTLNEMPTHNHIAQIHHGVGLGNTGAANGNKLASNASADTIYTDGDLSNTSVLAPGSVTINNAGSQQAFNIRNPFLSVSVCIALQGIFPSQS